MVVKTLLTAEFTPRGCRGHQEIGSAMSEQKNLGRGNGHGDIMLKRLSVKNPS